MSEPSRLSSIKRSFPNHASSISSNTSSSSSPPPSDRSFPQSSQSLTNHSASPSKMVQSISDAIVVNLPSHHHDEDHQDDHQQHHHEQHDSQSSSWTLSPSSRNRRKSNQDQYSSISTTPPHHEEPLSWSGDQSPASSIHSSVVTTTRTNSSSHSSSNSSSSNNNNSNSNYYSPLSHHPPHNTLGSSRSMSSPALFSMMDSRGMGSYISHCFGISSRSLHNDSFEMIPLTVLTLWKLEDYGVTSSTTTTTNPHGGVSPAKDFESNPFESVRSNEFHTFLESSDTTTNVPRSTKRRPEMVRGDSYMLMWCPWFNMYDNLFIEFWLVKLDESVVTTSNATHTRSNNFTNSSNNSSNINSSKHSFSQCSPSPSNDGSNNNNFRLLKVRQQAKALSKQPNERFFSGNIWGYSVVLNSPLNQTNESILSQYLANACPSSSTHFFGNDLENLIICFFGPTKLFKFKLNVKKEFHKNYKSKIKSEYVTDVESIDFVEALDYKSLRVHNAITPSSAVTTPTDVFFDVTNTVEEEEEMIDELYHGLFDSTSIISDSARKSLQLMSRIEMIHDHLQGYGFVRCDIHNNCHLYSLQRSDTYVPSPSSANESISDDSFLELQSPRSNTSITTTLSVCERRSCRIAHHSLSLVFFQRQIARKQYLNLKSPTSGRFEMSYSPHSKNHVKIGFEKIGHILPFHVESGKLNMMNHSNIKICKFDENLFLVMEIDEKNMKKQWEHYQLLQQHQPNNYFQTMNVTSSHESSSPPPFIIERNLMMEANQDKEFDALQFFKFYILDLSKSDDVKLSRLFTSYDATHPTSHATISQFSSSKIHEAYLKISTPKTVKNQSIISNSTISHNSFLHMNNLNRNQLTTSDTISHTNDTNDHNNVQFSLQEPHPSSPPSKQQLSPQPNNQFSLQVNLQHNMLPVYKNQKSKKKRFDTEFTFEKLISHMIVFRGDIHKNPHQYTIALFYNVKGDLKFFSSQHDFTGIGEFSKLRGKWFDFIHFTHVVSRSKTLFDQANLILNAGMKSEGNYVVSGLGFPDVLLSCFK
nr:unnamed protein product [Naegleria fowleri]